MTDRVVLCGGNEGEIWLHQKAWRRLVSADNVSLIADDPLLAAARARRWGLSSHPDIQAALRDRSAAIFLLFSPFQDRTAQAGALAYDRRHVALAPPFARTAEEGRRLVALAHAKGVVLASAEVGLLQAATAKLLDIVDTDTLGTLTVIRLRSILAGSGGWDPSLTPDFHAEEPVPAPATAPDLLFREVFEKLSLAMRILGPIAELAHLGQPASASAEQVSWKHQAEKKYGSLEIVRAPGMRLRSAYEPREDTLEITGSAGIAWASYGMGRLRNEPAVRIYLQEDLLSYQRIEEDYLYGVTAFARHLLGQVRARRADRSSLKRAIAAVAAAEIITKSPADGRRWPLGGSHD